MAYGVLTVAQDITACRFVRIGKHVLDDEFDASIMVAENIAIKVGPRLD